MKKILSRILFVGSISIGLTSQAQESPGLKSMVPPSPNASALGKYGDIPVSLYTGIPEISVPLYTLKSRELAIPISLNYHASGIRVEEIASWVGLGWSLSAGGVITRSLRGLPDDMGPGYFNTRTTVTEKIEGYPDYLSYSALPGDLTSGGNGITAEVTYYDLVIGQTTDSEPDIFYFNCGGHSGKFYMDSNGDFVSIPIQAMKIEYNAVTADGIGRWKLTMSDGVQYVFGTSTDGSRTALEKNNNGSMTPITGWYLLEMVSPIADRIDLYYQTESYQYESKSSEVINFNLPNASTDLGYCHWTPYEKKINTNHFDGVLLDHISCPTGSVYFNPYSADRDDLEDSHSLERIDVKDIGGQILKKVQFSYDYFLSTGCITGTSYCKRLKLDHLDITSPDGTLNGGVYQFDYNTVGLPNWDPYGTAMNAQDLWGYYNGASNSKLARGGGLVFDGQTHTIEGGDRHSDESYMLAGTLNKITYPTGGSTVFDFESNKLFLSSEQLGSTDIEPVSQTADRVVITGDVGVTEDFTVAMPWPVGASTSSVKVNLRQMVQHCPTDPNTHMPTCWEAYIEGRDGTTFTREYFPEGTTTVNLPPGDYRIGGSSFPNVEHLYSQNTLVYYVHLDWQEAPDASPTNKSDKTVGGLRIKRMTNNYLGTSTVRKYLYNAFTQTYSSGAAVNISAINADYFYAKGLINSFPVIEYLCQYLQSKSTTLVPLVPTLGGTIGYANVTELMGENGEGGKTEYTFTTAKDHPDTVKNFRPYPPSVSMDWRRGLLVKKSTYRNDAAKVQEIENTYTFGVDSKHGFGLSVSKLLATGIAFGPDYFVAGYNTVSEFSYRDTEKTRTYDQNNSSILEESVKTYEYGTTTSPAHYQLTTTSELNSKGEMLQTVNKYPQDVSLSGQAETARQSLVSKFMLDKVLEQDAIRDAVVVSKTVNNYKIFNSVPLLESIQQKNGSGPLETRIAISNYDTYGNILQQSKTNDYPNSYVWGYEHTLPIAEVKNAASGEVDYTSFETGSPGNWTYTASAQSEHVTGSASQNIANSVQKTGLTSSKKYKISYWFKGGTISSTKAAESGTQLTYTNAATGWTYWEGVITGVTSVTFSKGTGTTVLIDEMRLYPVGSQMTTYSYKQGIGVCSVTDANNMITYFEYDGLGRLVTVKDDKTNILKTYKYNYKQ